MRESNSGGKLNDQNLYSREDFHRRLSISTRVILCQVNVTQISNNSHFQLHAPSCRVTQASPSSRSAISLFIDRQILFAINNVYKIQPDIRNSAYCGDDGIILQNVNANNQGEKNSKQIISAFISLLFYNYHHRRDHRFLKQMGEARLICQNAFSTIVKIHLRQTNVFS